MADSRTVPSDVASSETLKDGDSYSSSANWTTPLSVLVLVERADCQRGGHTEDPEDPDE